MAVPVYAFDGCPGLRRFTPLMAVPVYDGPGLRLMAVPVYVAGLRRSRFTTLPGLRHLMAVPVSAPGLRHLMAVPVSGPGLRPAFDGCPGLRRPGFRSRFTTGS